MTFPRMPAPVIAAELAQRAEDLVRELFPDAKLHGSELRWHGRGGAVCSMVMRGTKQGIWCNWGDDREKGDALELVHYTLFPDEVGRREAIAWAARWLGMDNVADYDPAQGEKLRQMAVAALARQAQQAEANRDRARRRAIAMYLDEGRSRPLPHSEEIAGYLRRRGIPLDELASVPDSLRFTPDFAYDQQLLLPAMLAPIVLPGGHQIALHVTFLHRGDDGGWRKAGVEPAKKCYGAYSGGVIPLLRGRSGRPLARAPDGDTVLIAEGIENALAASLVVDDEPRVLACVSVGNLPNIALPAAIKTVILALDRDGENEAVRRKRTAARQRFLSEGRVVETMKTPEGVKDFSDYLVHDFWGAA